jgi:hypothetical protein
MLQPHAQAHHVHGPWGEMSQEEAALYVHIFGPSHQLAEFPVSNPKDARSRGCQIEPISS